MICFKKLVVNFCQYGFVFLSVSICHAQVADASFTELEEITVSGSTPKADNAVFSLPIVNISQKDTSNLGNLLTEELGVSSTAFGNNASRPVLRGMSGNRAPILQNSMDSGDLSSLSNDHAVSVDPVFLQKIQILRGSEALRYGSGSAAGLITIDNNRIAQTSISSPYAELQMQYNFQDKGYLTGLLTEGSVGKWSLHFDGIKKSSGDYVRPDGLSQNYSSAQLTDIGFGATYHGDQSYSGISYGEYRNTYGIPSLEGSYIDMLQKRLDLVHVIRNPMSGIAQIDLKYANTNYQHTELSTSHIPQTYFTNMVNQFRLEAIHEPIASWSGSFGLQLSTGQLGAIDLSGNGAIGANAAVIPKTQSNRLALFLVENTSVATVDIKTGLRFERVNQNPDSDIPYSDNPQFSNQVNYTSPLRTSVQNNLLSASSSAFWNYLDGYQTGLTLQMIQRPPAVDELFSYGNHDATGTFDIGNSGLNKETAYQIEWGWKKTRGLLQAQLNVYQNKTNDFIYGQYLNYVDLNTNYPIRQFTQANASLTGFESEVMFNPQESGLSARLFSDGVRGTFDDASNLPLQPAMRFGGHLGFKQGVWSTKLSLVHGMGQTRLATFETYPTPSYNKLDFRVSRRFNLGAVDGNLYFVANNLLNDTIRYSTTVETIRINAPLAGRNLMLGLSLFY